MRRKSIEAVPGESCAVLGLPLVFVPLWLLLMQELASAQVSATARVRAEVREVCPGKSKKKECKPKPPKPPKDEDEDDDEGDDDEDDEGRKDGRQTWGRSAVVQSVMENVEATGINGSDCVSIARGGQAGGSEGSAWGEG